MGQCYGKTSPANENDATTVTIVASSTDHNQPTSLPSSTSRNGVVSVKNTPARSSSTHPSPWPSTYPHGVAASPLPGGVSPSPARASTPRRFFRRPFPPPSPAKHIAASLVKRLGGGGKPKEGPIPEHGGVEAEQQQQQQQSLDKSFGYSKNFGAKYELGKEIGRGHFGHTCSATVKKGELKDQTVAVKIISKAKALVRNATDAMRESRAPEILNAMESLAYRKMYFEEFCAAAISTYQLEALEGWEQIASAAFEHFEQEGNRVISVEELARELNVGPSAYTFIKDWIRNSDGKLSLIGYTKFLHGVTLRSSNTRPR